MPQEKCGRRRRHPRPLKVVLVHDVVKPLLDGRGVVTMSVFDFLLDENSLAGI